MANYSTGSLLFVFMHAILHIDPGTTGKCNPPNGYTCHGSSGDNYYKTTAIGTHTVSKGNCEVMVNIDLTLAGIGLTIIC